MATAEDMNPPKGPRWFEAMRTSLADPVLDRRLRLYFEHHPPSPKEAERRGVVFDLVVGSKSPEEAVLPLASDPEKRAALLRTLSQAPDLSELREALIEAGRAEEAQSLTAGVPLEGGEFEARSQGRPEARPHAEKQDRLSAGDKDDVAESSVSETASSPHAVSSGPSAAPLAPESDLEDLLRAVDRVEAKLDHVLSLVRLTAFSAVGVLVVLALWAVIR